MQTEETRNFWSQITLLTFLLSPQAPAVAVAAVVGGGLIGLLPSGPYAAQFAALVGLVMLDMLLGTLRGLVFDRRGWDSKKFLRGLVKTAFILAIPLCLFWAAHLEKETGYLFRAASSATVVWFGAYEILSIIRNAGRCGVPVPKKVVELLEGTLDSAERLEEKQR